MSDDPIFDLTSLARQQRQLLTELGSLRDEMAVLSATAMRLEGTLPALVTELRAMHIQHSRLANRVRALEERS